MRILYKNKTAKEQFSSEYMRKWKYPEPVKKKLVSAEDYIKNAKSLKDIAAYKPFRLEKLKGERHIEWSIRLGGTGYRVTFIPCDDKEKTIIDGDIVSRCKFIKVIKVTEVSNHYE